MKSTDNRNLFTTLIGADAASGDITVIPTSQGTPGDGTASIDLAFPPETFISTSAGGKRPRGQDVNGFLNLLSAATQVLQADFFGPYSAALSASIGGYPLNSIVSAGAAGQFWVSTVEDNTTVPGATGASWVGLFTFAPGRLLGVQTFFATGIYTPTPGTTVSYQHVYGAGGGAAGSPATSSVQTSAAGGGGSGAYTWKKVTSPTTQDVTVGTGGLGGNGNNGQNGGGSAIGTYLAAGGGLGGQIAGPTGTNVNFIANGGAGGTVSVSGDFAISGMPGNFGNVIASTSGGQGVNLNGTPGMWMHGYGYGGAPNSNPASTAAKVGEAGQNGFVICYDYS